MKLVTLIIVLILTPLIARAECLPPSSVLLFGDIEDSLNITNNALISAIQFICNSSYEKGYINGVESRLDEKIDISSYQADPIEIEGIVDNRMQNWSHFWTTEMSVTLDDIRDNELQMISYMYNATIQEQNMSVLTGYMTADEVEDFVTDEVIEAKDEINWNLQNNTQPIPQDYTLIGTVVVVALIGIAVAVNRGWIDLPKKSKVKPINSSKDINDIDTEDPHEVSSSIIDEFDKEAKIQFKSNLLKMIRESSKEPIKIALLKEIGRRFKDGDEMSVLADELAKIVK